MTLADAEKLIRDAVSAIAIKGGITTSVPSVRDYFETELKSRVPSLAPSTTACYANTVQTLLAWLGNESEHPVTNVTQALLLNFQQHLSGSFAPSVVNLHLAIISTLLRKAVASGWLSVNPGKTTPRVKISQTHTRRPFTPDEIRQVLLALSDSREWTGLVLLGLHTAQRLGDLLPMRWSFVDRPTWTLNLTQQKTGQQVSVPLHSDVVQWLEAQPVPLNPDTRIFPTLYAKGTTAVSHEFRRILSRAGVGRASKSFARKQFDLSFHSFRHTAISAMQANGASKAVAQALAGHASEAVNYAYTHLSPDDIRPWIAKTASVL